MLIVTDINSSNRKRVLQKLKLYGHDNNKLNPMNKAVEICIGFHESSELEYSNQPGWYKSHTTKPYKEIKADEWLELGVDGKPIRDDFDVIKHFDKFGYRAFQDIDGFCCYLCGWSIDKTRLFGFQLNGNTWKPSSWEPDEIIGFW